MLLLENFNQDHINVKNSAGLTALDMVIQLGQGNVEIKDMLSKVRALQGSFLPNSSTETINSLRSKMSCFKKLAIKAARGRQGISNEMRNTFLVVTVLIITATYDATVNPPSKKGDKDTSFNTSEKANSPNASPWDLYLPDIYGLFWLYNTLTFWASTALTAYLLPNRSICLFLLITLSLFGSCYTLLTVSISSDLLNSYQLLPGHTYSGNWYYSLSVVNYVFSSLLALLIAYRIARYVCFKFAMAGLKSLIIILCLSFVFIAALILTPATLFAEYMWRYFFFRNFYYGW